MYVADNLQIALTVADFLAQYRCESPEDAGMTMAEAARDLALPWLDDPGAALGDDHALYHFRAAHPGTGAHVWHAIHGSRRRDFMVATARAEGWEIAHGQEPDLTAASEGASDFHAYALSFGWDVAYQPFCRAGRLRADLADKVTAFNPDTGDMFDQKWAAGKIDTHETEPLARSRERIRTSPRTRHMRPLDAAPGPFSSGRDFPSAIPSQASRTGQRTRSPSSARRAARRTPRLPGP